MVMTNVWSLSVVIMLLHVWFLNVTAEIRCYCNLPSCVSTGYMCKSTAGVCFSEIPHLATYYNVQRYAIHLRRTQHIDGSLTRHGCFEMLRSHHKSMECKRSSYRSNESKHLNDATVAKSSHVACCRQDMCNYIDSRQDINIQINTKSNNTQIIDGVGYGREKTRLRNLDEASLRHDLWFKAAVIAVPIAGGFILILLIFLAVRMLRKDNAHRKRVRRHHQFKSPLFHYCDKNAKINGEYLKANSIFKNDVSTMDDETRKGTVVGAACSDSEDNSLLRSVLFCSSYTNAENNVSSSV